MSKLGVYAESTPESDARRSETPLERLDSKLEELTGELRVIVTGAQVEQIYKSEQKLTVAARSQVWNFDYVVATTPSSVFAQMVPDLDSRYRARLEKMRYMGMVCAVMLLKRKVTPYYCTNITEELPFTGIIEMTNLISREETSGRHLVYLPKYTSPGDPLFNASDDQVWDLFYSNLQRVVPDLKDDEVEKHFIFRERLVQPIPLLNYSELVPEMETNVPNLLLANTTQIVNSTLNNNEMVKIAGKAVETVLQRSRTPVAGPQAAASFGSGLPKAVQRFSSTQEEGEQQLINPTR